MDSKGGNPFLMDDYYEVESNDRIPAQAAASNPFLQDFAEPEATGGGENPFLNFAGDQTYQSNVPVDSTNPFASFAAEAEEAAPSTDSEATTTDTTTANIFSGQSANIFATSGSKPSSNLFDASLSSQSSDELFGQSAPPPTPAAPTSPAQPKNGKTAPSRPPPPRPQPPAPPKNTKDLILSVTGALDATSNHLLDRLQVCIARRYEFFPLNPPFRSTSLFVSGNQNAQSHFNALSVSYTGTQLRGFLGRRLERSRLAVR